jgi:hypothetical protein
MSVFVCLFLTPVERLLAHSHTHFVVIQSLTVIRMPHGSRSLTHSLCGHSIAHGHSNASWLPPTEEFDPHQVNLHWSTKK